MCGRKSKAGWWLVACFFLASLGTSWAEDYLGPPLMDGWYPISEAELTQLETLQKQQETRLDELLSLSTVHEQTIAQLETSLQTYEKEVWTSRWVWGSIGFLSGAAVTLIMVLVGGR